jgi:hypothetical protein
MFAGASCGTSALRFAAQKSMREHSFRRVIVPSFLINNPNLETGFFSLCAPYGRKKRVEKGESRCCRGAPRPLCPPIPPCAWVGCVTYVTLCLGSRGGESRNGRQEPARVLWRTKFESVRKQIEASLIPKEACTPSFEVHYQ